VPGRGKRVVLFQTWEFRGNRYILSLYRIEERKGRGPRVSVLRTRYYAVSTAVLMRLMRQAGFTGVRQLDSVYFQPVLVGRRR